MKRKRLIIILSVLLCVALALYFGYKGMLLYIYNKTNNNYYSNFVLNYFDYEDTLNIKRKTIPKSEYFVISDSSWDEKNVIKIRNDFKEYELVGDIYTKKNEDKLEGVFRVEKNPSMVYLFNNFSYELLLKNYIDEEIDFYDFLSYIMIKISFADLSEIIVKENITNDIELINYVKEIDYDVNIFSSIKNIKKTHTIKQLFTIYGISSLKKCDSITLIEGDYSGYICNDSESKMINILYKDFVFEFLIFKSESFNDEYIRDLFSTLVIEG